MRTIKIKLQIDGVEISTQLTEESYNSIKNEFGIKGLYPPAMKYLEFVIVDKDGN